MSSHDNSYCNNKKLTLHTLRLSQCCTLQFNLSRLSSRDVQKTYKEELTISLS